MADQNLTFELVVDGKKIETNEFVHKIIGNVLYGILKSLRLEESPREATFNMRIG